MHALALDAAVRDWVLVPLTLTVVLMMVLRQYITKVGTHRNRPLSLHIACGGDVQLSLQLSIPACVNFNSYWKRNGT